MRRFFCSNNYSLVMIFSSLFRGRNFIKSSISAPVAVSIFDMLCVLGHLSWPALDHLLLRLKVVGSNPPDFASPEQESFLSAANCSMAFQTSACVILALLS